MLTPVTAAAAFLFLCGSYLVCRGLQMLASKSEYSVGEKLLYAPCYTLARMLWRVRIAGGKQIADMPIRGGVIVANHRCSLDPFFVQLAAGRRVHWMVASEYFRHPLFGSALRTFQAVPTNRSGSDNASTKRVISLAQDGRLVGLFPEGRINRSEDPLLPLRPGALLIAERAERPIIPLWIDGAPRGGEVWHPFLMPARVVVHVGSQHTVRREKTGTDRKEQAEVLRRLLLAARHDGVD